MTGGEPGSGRAAALRRIEATYVDAVDDKMRQLVRNVFKQGSVGQQPESSSVAFVSQLTHKRTGVADSADFPLGVRSFSEWWSLASCSSIVRVRRLPPPPPGFPLSSPPLLRRQLLRPAPIIKQPPNSAAARRGTLL